LQGQIYSKFANKFGLMSILFVMDWFGFTFGLNFNIFCLFIRFGYIWFGFSFGWLPESLFPTVGSVAGARQRCSFLLGGSLSSKSDNK
jgi:hypothetical protein